MRKHGSGNRANKKSGIEDRKHLTTPRILPVDRFSGRKENKEDTPKGRAGGTKVLLGATCQWANGQQRVMQVRNLNGSPQQY